MVSNTCYSPTDSRRYTSRPNPIYLPDRRPNGYPGHTESRNTVSEREGSTDSSPQRKRIAVACGRCRKRKIRCSGDNGNGACTNCKNAGFEPCQFLRVSSQETCMKNEWSYGLDSSRQYQARGATTIPPPAHQYPNYAENIAVTASDAHFSRSGLAHPFSVRQYHTTSPLASWHTGYSEDQAAVGYPIYPGYPAIQDSEYHLNYRMNPGAGSRNHGTLIIDTDNNYTFGSGPSTATTALVHRPAPVTTPTPSPAVDSTFSFQSVATGLSSALNGGDRVLPAPIGRILPSSGPLSSRNNSTSPTYSRGSRTSTSGTSPTSPFSEVSSSYTSYEPAPMASYPPTSHAMHMTRPSDAYPTPASSDGGVFSPTVSTRPPSSAPEMTYRYTDNTTHRDAGSGLPLIHYSNGICVPQGHTHHAPYMLPSDIGSGSSAEADSEDRKAGILRG